MENYFRKEAASNSGLKILLDKTPAHYQFWKQNPKPRTDAMLFGSAVHCAILEPQEYDNRYYQLPPMDKRTKEGKALYAQLMMEHLGKEVLTFDQHNNAMMIKDSALADPMLKNILTNGECEKEIYWKREGIDMKAKLDFLSSDIILDIKTTQDASEYSFNKSIANFKYHMQAAIYTEAAKQIHGKDIPFVIMAIENTAPFDYCFYHLDSEWLEKGLDLYLSAFNIYKDCMENGIWPGYEKSIQSISMPSWL